MSTAFSLAGVELQDFSIICFIDFKRVVYTLPQKGKPYFINIISLQYIFPDQSHPHKAVFRVLSHVNLL